MSVIKIYYPCGVLNLSKSLLLELAGFSPKITINDVKKYYKCVYETIVVFDDINEYLSDVFALFNSDNNPLNNIESQKMIQEYETHTSASVGDVININDIYYMVDGFGFTKIPN